MLLTLTHLRSEFVDFHLKPYRCNVPGCRDMRFWTATCMLRHRLEEHTILGQDDKLFTWTSGRRAQRHRSRLGHLHDPDEDDLFTRLKSLIHSVQYFIREDGAFLELRRELSRLESVLSELQFRGRYYRIRRGPEKYDNELAAMLDNCELALDEIVRSFMYRSGSGDSVGKLQCDFANESGKLRIQLIRADIVDLMGTVQFGVMNDTNKPSETFSKQLDALMDSVDKAAANAAQNLTLRDPNTDSWEHRLRELRANGVSRDELDAYVVSPLVQRTWIDLADI